MPRVSKAELFAARLNGLASKAILRIQAYQEKRPNVSRETLERITEDNFANTYLKAREAGFAGDLTQWVRFCTDLLNHYQEEARRQR